MRRKCALGRPVSGKSPAFERDETKAKPCRHPRLRHLSGALPHPNMKLTHRILIATLATAIAVPAISLAAKADRKKKNDTAAPSFATLDKDGDGVVTEAEFLAAKKESLGDEAAKAQFGKLDKDTNGKLSQEEFAAGEEAPKKKRKKDK
jgi:hypothetical protein